MGEGREAAGCGRSPGRDFLSVTVRRTAGRFQDQGVLRGGGGESIPTGVHPAHPSTRVLWVYSRDQDRYLAPPGVRPVEGRTGLWTCQTSKVVSERGRAGWSPETGSVGSSERLPAPEVQGRLRPGGESSGRGLATSGNTLEGEADDINEGACVLRLGVVAVSSPASFRVRECPSLCACGLGPNLSRRGVQGCVKHLGLLSSLGFMRGTGVRPGKTGGAGLRPSAYSYRGPDLPPVPCRVRSGTVLDPTQASHEGRVPDVLNRRGFDRTPSPPDRWARPAPTGESASTPCWRDRATAQVRPGLSAAPLGFPPLAT